LIKKLSGPTQQAIQGSLHRASRNRRPRHNEINWPETIKKNLKHYQPNYQTIVPETRIGYGRRRRAMKDIILCIDQSGSMATSVVYSGIFGAVMASIPAVSTKMVVFDTAVVDLTEDLKDPVELLFGVQLGGGTDIHQALTYCQQLISRPSDTTLILISDLYEGGNQRQMKKKAYDLVQSGVQVITLLALNDEGAPYYDHQHAAYFSSIGIPVFACSPDLFPDMMAAALRKEDISQWAGRHQLILKN
ncbi:MAG: VWA domain-containing protein, partial [Bacteroidota bacterium]